MKNFVALCFTALAAATGAEAQSLRWVAHTGHYGAVGAGHHGLTLTCDSLCPAANQGTSSFDIALGRHINHRVRLEFAASVGMNTERRSTFLSAGLASYLVSGLHVRGAVTTTQLDITDSVTNIQRNGGMGFLVGAGFDIPIGRTWAVTPSVNYASSSAKSMDVTPGSGTTMGSYHSLNIGVTLTRLAGMYQCTNRAGERIWAKPSNRERALACLAEVEGGASRPGIKL
jgi:opacity protein-like surface antigen